MATGGTGVQWTSRACCLLATVLASEPVLAQPRAEGTESTIPAPATPSADGALLFPTEDRTRDPFVWRYPEFSASDYVATALFGGLAIAGQLLPTDQPRWRSTNSVDESVRDALRLDSKESRKTADDISDLSLALGLNYAAFDTAVVAWALRGKGSVAYQMAAINVQVLAVTAGISSISKAVLARERPYAQECEVDSVLQRTDDCEPDSVNVSFISGHASISFAAASVTCMHHAHLELYQSTAADAAACIGAYTAAATTSVLRMMSDNHYATDVTSGAAVGTLVGLGLPYLLHYRFEVVEPDEMGRASTTSVSVVPGPASATVVGTF